MCWSFEYIVLTDKNECRVFKVKKKELKQASSQRR